LNKNTKAKDIEIVN